MDRTEAASPPRASEHDREYMRRIGRIHEEIEQEELAEHVSRAPRERMVAALALMLQGPYFEPRNPRDADDPSQFYERAKRLGLYRR